MDKSAGQKKGLITGHWMFVYCRAYPSLNLTLHVSKDQTAVQCVLPGLRFDDIDHSGTQQTVDTVHSWYLKLLISRSKFSGPSCSKLTTSLVNVSLKFQTLISQIRRYFLLKKCEAFALQKLLSFFQQKISVHLVIKS